jgi:hypothetical protein
MSAIYNLFLRNWKNHRANDLEIDEAVTKRLLTEEQGNEIKNTER